MVDVELGGKARDERATGLTWEQVGERLGTDKGTAHDLATGKALSVEKLNQIRLGMGMDALGDLRLVGPDQKVVTRTPEQRRQSPSYQRRKELRRRAQHYGITVEDAAEAMLQMLDDWHDVE